MSCPKCQSTEHRKYGYQTTSSGKTPRAQCLKCGTVYVVKKQTGGE